MHNIDIYIYMLAPPPRSTFRVFPLYCPSFAVAESIFLYEFLLNLTRNQREILNSWISHFWKDFPLYEFLLKFNLKLKRNPSFLDFSFLEGFSSI